MLSLAICSLFWLIAGFIAGITSFGGNLVAVPFNTLVVEPAVAILAGCISGTAVFAGLTFFYWRRIIWAEAAFLLLGAAGGIPFGIWFLKGAGARAILLAAGVCLILFLAWQFAQARLGKRLAVSRSYAFPFGLVSGMMMGAVGMGGPPLVLYAYLRQWQKEETIGTVNAASVAFMFLVLPWQYFSGLYNQEIIRLGLAGALAAFIGISASIPVVARINITIFRRLLLLMLSASAVMLIFRALS